MSYKVTRGIILVVGGVTEMFILEFGGSKGGQRWSGPLRGGLLDPYRALIAPLEVLYGTRFGYKDNIMIQLANIYNIGITDPFLELWGPPGDSQKAIYKQIQAVLRPQIVTNMAF